MLDGDGAPLGTGALDIVCVDGETSRVSLDEDGRFLGPECSASACLRLLHPRVAQPQAWEVEAGGWTGQWRGAWAPRLDARVLDEHGVPIAAAQALVRVEPGDGLLRAGTDADGHFSLAVAAPSPCDRCMATCPERDPEGVMHLLVQSPGHAPFSQELRPSELGGEAREIVLGPPADPLRGRVVDADGRAFAARTRVLALGVDRALETHAARVEEDGSFSMSSLGEGLYELRAVRDGIELATARGRGGEELVLSSERVASIERVELEILDPEGSPCVGVRIDGGPFAGARSDARGRVVGLGVVPETYTLRLSGQEGQGGGAVELDLSDPEGSGAVKADLEWRCR
ncbi:hypothetical protein PPSIR1_15175 [Plesiocystis pacifica SIR-1]|uniref:Carboxypeptidase regulatory-like domain-containing protein n=1 Tax=Plesiocystis pacifica SIR-1 TaxID=391625 RepID=A6G6G2_9BACT|nr:carboxypeptidase-like regulatory domain-containing protein [Plesiocystis pacifica]EDM78591.1 hypothetical protein PPSIR1_15175 [Plesiocystis pacifica SIR-1]